MEEVENFIYEREGKQQEILLYFHHLLAEQLNLMPKIRYRIPFYYQKSWVCYLNPIKKEGIELAFIKGNQLSNSQGLLQTKNRKQIRGIEVYELANLQEIAIFEIIQEALLIDEMKSSSV